MPKSRIGGKKFNPGGSASEVKQRGWARETGRTRPVEKVADDQRLDPDAIPLPERHEGFSARPSKLQGVIEAGLSRLSAAEGFQAQDTALGVLVRALAGVDGPSVSFDTYVGVLRGELRHALESAPAQVSAAELRRDAIDLLTLAMTALGTDGLPSAPAKAEAVLAEDIRVVKDALGDVLKRGDPQAVERLRDTHAGLTWAADVLNRGAPVLQKVDATASARLDALAGVLRIVLKYAQQGK